MMLVAAVPIAALVFVATTPSKSAPHTTDQRLLLACTSVSRFTAIMMEGKADTRDDPPPSQPLSLEVDFAKKVINQDDGVVMKITTVTGVAVIAQNDGLSTHYVLYRLTGDLTTKEVNNVDGHPVWIISKYKCQTATPKF